MMKNRIKAAAVKLLVAALAAIICGGIGVMFGVAVLDEYGTAPAIEQTKEV